MTSITTTRPKSLPQSQYGRTWLHHEDFPIGYFWFKAVETREKYLAEKELERERADLEYEEYCRRELALEEQQRKLNEYTELFETMFGVI